MLWVTSRSLLDLCICLPISTCPSSLNSSFPQSHQALPTSTSPPLPFPQPPNETLALQPSPLNSVTFSPLVKALQLRGLAPPSKYPAFFNHAPELVPPPQATPFRSPTPPTVVDSRLSPTPGAGSALVRGGPASPAPDPPVAPPQRGCAAYLLGTAR